MKKLFFLITLIFIFSAFIIPVYAQDEGDSDVLSRGYLVPACAVNDATTCGLCDLIQFLVDAIQFLAGGASAFALLFFVIGGFYWVFSMGNEQRVATGKKIMIGAITGVVIIIMGWVIINTVIIVASSGGEGFGGEAKLFPETNPTSWFEVRCIQ